MKAVCCPSGDDRLHSSRNAVPLNNIKHYNNGKLNRPWHVPEVRPAGFRIVHFLIGLRACRIGRTGSEQQAQAVEGARKINPAAVEVLLDNNRRMTLDFTETMFSGFSGMTEAVLSEIPRRNRKPAFWRTVPGGRFPGWMWTSRAMRLSSLRGRSGLR